MDILSKAFITKYLLTNPVTDEYTFTLKDKVAVVGFNTLDNQDVLVLMESGTLLIIPTKLLEDFKVLNFIE